MHIKNSGRLNNFWMFFFINFLEAAHRPPMERRACLVRCDLPEWHALIQSGHQFYLIQLSDHSWHTIHSKEKFLRLGDYVVRTGFTVLGYHAVGKMNKKRY